MSGTGAVRRLGGLLVVGLLGLSTMVGGCSNVSKSKYDASVQEAAELRERNAQIEASLRERDLKLADCEAKLAQGNQAAPIVYTNNPSTPSSYDQLPQSGGESPFQRNSQGQMAAELAGNVLFDPGSAVVKSSGRKSLDRIASSLNGQFAGREARIEGHTDSDPIKHSKWASNDALSQARADAVKKYLTSKGVSSRRLSAIGYGSSQPKGSKAASRRVEIVITN
jgi:outer membrane protein OmpA-like peptidoglycan-associated protein